MMPSHRILPNPTNGRSRACSLTLDLQDALTACNSQWRPWGLIPLAWLPILIRNFYDQLIELSLRLLQAADKRVTQNIEGYYVSHWYALHAGFIHERSHAQLMSDLNLCNFGLTPDDLSPKLQLLETIALQKHRHAVPDAPSFLHQK